MAIMVDRKYQFSWNLLGDLAMGRPNLGPTTSLEAYRLMQFTFRDVLEKNVGTEKTNAIFYEAGKLAGVEFYKNAIPNFKDFNEFIKKLQETFRELGMGILRVEEADLGEGSVVLTMSEDLDCSGLPELGYEVCTYDEGFISGLLESFTDKAYTVKEVDCWCTGDRTCRFAGDTIKSK
jgi:uncharacterized protein